MSKKKPLPDGNTLFVRMAEKLREKYPAAWRVFPDFRQPILRRQAVTELAARHNIPADFDLATPLNAALHLYYYSFAKRQSDPTHVQRKKYLEKVIEHAKELNALLSRMDSDMQFSIYEQWDYLSPHDDPPSKYRWCWRMYTDTRRLAAAAPLALSAMQPYTSADMAFRMLMDQLVDVYESATRKQVAGITKDPYGDVAYSQPIVRFFEESLRLAGIEKTNSAVGQALYSAIKRRR